MRYILKLSFLFSELGGRGNAGVLWCLPMQNIIKEAEPLFSRTSGQWYKRENQVSLFAEEFICYKQIIAMSPGCINSYFFAQLFSLRTVNISSLMTKQKELLKLTYSLVHLSTHCVLCLVASQMTKLH